MIGVTFNYLAAATRVIFISIFRGCFSYWVCVHEVESGAISDLCLLWVYGWKGNNPEWTHENSETNQGIAGNMVKRRFGKFSAAAEVDGRAI